MLQKVVRVGPVAHVADFAKSNRASHGRVSRKPPVAPAGTRMIPRIVMFTQPGCLSCELMRVFLEARQIPFEERDIVSDPEARSAMTAKYDSAETPTLVVFSENSEDVIIGFDPERLDHFLGRAPSSDSVTEP